MWKRVRYREGMGKTMRQLIIVRKDLNMSPGKLAAQVSHASMSFLMGAIKENVKPVWKYRTYSSYREDPITQERKLKPYKHPDLCRYAILAYDKGEDSFTVKESDTTPGHLELCENEIVAYSSNISFDKDVFEQWINGIFTKTICEAKNRNQLMKAVAIAEELGFKKGEDFFLIKDNCLTELEPEEIGEDGVGRTLTCIGFRPLSDDMAHNISHKFQLYK